MSNFTITINDAEEKALLTDMISIQEWLDNAIHEKARRVIDTIIEEATDKRAKKVPVKEKYNLIREMVLETAAERSARFETKLLERT